MYPVGHPEHGQDPDCLPDTTEEEEAQPGEPTGGEWWFATDFDEVQAQTEDGDYLILARVCNGPTEDTKQPDSPTDEREALANGYLMAAAPVLLWAALCGLAAIRGAGCSWAGSRDAVELLEAAIRDAAPGGVAPLRWDGAEFTEEPPAPARAGE